MNTRSEPGTPAPEGVIPLSVPHIRGNEWKYVKEALDSNWVSSAGPFVERFENTVAEYVGAKYAVATASGTAALHIALLISGVQPEDEVLVSTLTFIAPANAIRYVGAWPVFIDADPEFWQLDTKKLADFLDNECEVQNGTTLNKKTGRRVTAMLLVHILGHPCDMDPILVLARKYNLTVIEDAAESLGARYKDRMVGQLGDIACLSFNGNKIMTTGGGGMILTDRAEWAQRARYLTTQAKDNPVEYIHNEIGYNYRLTNLQAALGCAQMELLDEFISAKRAIADAYTTALRDIHGITPMQEASWAFSTFWMYTIMVDEGRYGLDSRGLLRSFSEHSVQARPLWQPIHLSRAHVGACAYSCEVAERLYGCCLSLPCSAGLDTESQDRVIALLRPE